MTTKITKTKITIECPKCKQIGNIIESLDVEEQTVKVICCEKCKIGIRDLISSKKEIPKNREKVIFYFRHTGLDVGVFCNEYCEEIGYAPEVFESKDGFLGDELVYWKSDNE